MTGEQLEAAWRWAHAPLPASVFGAWALLAALVAVFIVRFRKDWREGAKAAAALVAASVALGFLVWRASRESPEFLYVDQVIRNPEVMGDRRLQVCGHIACGSIERRAGTDSYRFKLQGSQPQANVVLEVRFTGRLPDTFRAGRLVVVTGRLGADGGLDVVKDGIMVSTCGYSLPLYCGSLSQRELVRW